jgi:hypothetical protein
MEKPNRQDAGRLGEIKPAETLVGLNEVYEHQETLKLSSRGRMLRSALMNRPKRRLWFVPIIQSGSSPRVVERFLNPVE